MYIVQSPFTTPVLDVPEVRGMQQDNEPQGAISDGVSVVGDGRRVQIAHRRNRVRWWWWWSRSSSSCCCWGAVPSSVNTMLDVLKYFRDAVGLCRHSCCTPLPAVLWCCGSKSTNYRACPLVEKKEPALGVYSDLDTALRLLGGCLCRSCVVQASRNT